jgi:hypothetical protein
MNANLMAIRKEVSILANAEKGKYSLVSSVLSDVLRSIQIIHENSSEEDLNKLSGDILAAINERTVSSYKAFLRELSKIVENMENNSSIVEIQSITSCPNISIVSGGRLYFASEYIGVTPLKDYKYGSDNALIVDEFENELYISPSVEYVKTLKKSDEPYGNFMNYIKVRTPISIECIEPACSDEDIINFEEPVKAVITFYISKSNDDLRGLIRHLGAGGDGIRRTRINSSTLEVIPCIEILEPSITIIHNSFHLVSNKMCFTSAPEINVLCDVTNNKIVIDDESALSILQFIHAITYKISVGGMGGWNRNEPMLSIIRDIYNEFHENMYMYRVDEEGDSIPLLPVEEEGGGDN